MIKLEKTIGGVAALVALTLLAACQPKTDSGDAADASQTPIATTPATTSRAVGAREGESERLPGAGDDGAHGPRAGMEMGRAARERGMGMAPNATPPADKSPQ